MNYNINLGLKVGLIPKKRLFQIGNTIPTLKINKTNSSLFIIQKV